MSRPPRAVRAARSRGVTLIELIVVVAMLAVVMLAVTSAFVAGIDAERNEARRRQSADRAVATEQRLTRLLQGARLSDDPNDTLTYFVGDLSDGSGAGGEEAGGDAAAASDGGGCDRLTFTTIAAAVPMAVRDDADDWATQHERRGPVGGTAEAQLSTVPVGADAGDRAGLFERVQRPADGDRTQGGEESLLDPDVEIIAFRFWNGTDWSDTWDTEGAQGKRLPAAVEVRYTLRGDASGAARTLLVPIPSSDVDANDPVNTGPGGSAGGAGGGATP